MKKQFNNLAVYLPKFFELKEIMEGDALPSLSNGDSEYYEREGYPQIGTATLVIDFLSESQIAGKHVESLRSQLAAMRAKHQREQNALIDQISKLQALTFEGVVE